MQTIFATIFPGMMYFWLCFIGQGPMQEILQEKETNTMQRLLATPVTLNQFVLSKMLRCYLLCGLVQVLMILMSAFVFGIHWGNPLALALVVAVGTLSISGVLSVIFGLARTKDQGHSLSSIVLLVFALLGGSMIPFESLPAILQAVGWISPNRWGILALQTVIQAKPVSDLVKPLLILGAIGLTGSLWAFWLFQRHLLPGRRG